MSIALEEDQETEESAEVSEEELFLTINLKILHMKTLLKAESKLMPGISIIEVKRRSKRRRRLLLIKRKRC